MMAEGRTCLCVRYACDECRKLRGGMAPVDYVANFPRIKKVTGDRQVVAQAIRGSSMLQLSRDGRRVGRKDNPAILAEAAYRLVELMHLAPESTVSSVRAMTEPHGTVVHVDVFLEDEEAVARGAAPAFQQALVEFADAEAALRVSSHVAGGGASVGWSRRSEVGAVCGVMGAVCGGAESQCQLAVGLPCRLSQRHDGRAGRQAREERQAGQGRGRGGQGPSRSRGGGGPGGDDAHPALPG